MASVASQLIEEVTAHAQSASFEDAREICADGTYFPNNLRNNWIQWHDQILRLLYAIIDSIEGSVRTVRGVTALSITTVNKNTQLSKVQTPMRHWENLQFLLCIYPASCTVYYPDQQMHSIYINNIL